MVWQRIGELNGMLGSLRLRKSNLDTRSSHLLVSDFQSVLHSHFLSLLIVFHSPQLCLRWPRLSRLSFLSLSKPVPRPQRH
jgi:hypothetical protein